MKSKTYRIIFVLFLVLYSIWISSSFNEIQLSYDESRHAASGLIWYDYIRTISSDGYVEFGTFVNQYQQKGYNAGWFANQDLPGEGILRAGFYMIFGTSFFAIRIFTLVCAIISAILTYMIALRITKKESIAFASSLMLLMSTLFFMYSAIQSLAPIPNVMMVLFWYYFTFVRKVKKQYKISLGTGMVVRYNHNILFGGIFLTWATLIKYSAALFIDIFFVLYMVYLIGSYVRRHKKISLGAITSSGVIQIAFVALIQNLIFLLVSYKWLKYNLFDMGWLQRIQFYSGTVTSASHDLNYIGNRFPWMDVGLFSDWTYMIHGYLQRTGFFILFFFVALYMLFKKKIEDTYTRRHFILISLFSLAVYLYFSLQMRNHQIRYIVHPFPFVIIMSAFGLYYVVNKYKKSRIFVTYSVVVLAFVVGLFFLNTWIYDQTLSQFGEKNDELYDYLSSKQDPKFLIHTRQYGPAIRPPNWYYNPDYVMFTFMRTKQGYNPATFTQQAPLVEFRENTPMSYEQATPGLVGQLDQISAKVPVYVVVFRHNTDGGLYSLFGQSLLDKGFVQHNLTYWIVYQKE